jgi:uncharacterized GH25 family protein
MKRKKGKRSWLKVCILVIALSIIAPQAEAHNLWLGLNHYSHTVGGTAKVFLYLAHSLPFDDFGRPENMKEFFYLDPSGERKDFELKEPDPESFFNEVGIPFNVLREGTYLAGVAMKPIFKSTTPKGSKMQSKKEISDAMNCRYVEFFAKAIFHAGKPGGDAYATVLNHTIEMVPQKDPCLIKAGDYLPVKVIFRGKPLVGQFVYATYIGFSTKEDYAYTTRTDHKGMAMIRIGNPGIWWVKAPYKEHYEDQSECDIGQYATIMTFEVK